MIPYTSIRDVHAAYNKKEISPSELTEQYIRAAKKNEFNSFISVSEDRARAQAKKADEVLKTNGAVPEKDSPLFGIPLGIKDLLTIDGVRTTCASKILDQYIPPYTATAVQRLENAGAISLGKMNMDEFAMGSSNENSAYGNVKNPVKTDRVAGGSSGGSAAAVKARECLGALGTDTGGSIRLPASFCGVVGFKPTYGRISRYGLIAFASSLDQIGPLTNTVEDAAILFRAMAGQDPLDSTSAPVETTDWVAALQRDAGLKGLRIGVPKEYFIKGIDASVEKAVRDSLAWYEKQGAELVEVSLPHTEFAVPVYYIVAVSEASSNLAQYDGIRFGNRPVGSDEKGDLLEFYKKVRTQFGDEVKRRIILGTFALSSGYYDAYYNKACQVRRLIKGDFDKAFKKVDLIAAPTSPVTAFKQGDKVDDPLQMYLVDVFTISASLAGLPAMSMPCGEDSEGLPIGFQLIGPHFAEERVLSAAHAFEKGRS